MIGDMMHRAALRMFVWYRLLYDCIVYAFYLHFICISFAIQIHCIQIASALHLHCNHTLVCVILLYVTGDHFQIYCWIEPSKYAFLLVDRISPLLYLHMMILTLYAKQKGAEMIQTERADYYHWKAMVLIFRIDKLRKELAEKDCILPRSGRALLNLYEQRLVHCLKMESYFVWLILIASDRKGPVL